MSNESKPKPRLDLQFDYAWRWFAFHAHQRISMFSFFLIGIGILANAYVLLLSRDFRNLAGGLAIVAAVTCIVFVLLDQRNHQLVHVGEEMLKQLEADILVPSSDQPVVYFGPFGQEEALGQPPRYVKHKFLIEGLEILIGVGFAIASVYAFANVD